MNHMQFLNRVIDNGIAAATKNYTHSQDKKLGAIAGFEACRHKAPDELRALLAHAGERREAMRGKSNYWWYRCFEAEVEWVCNVVSAVLLNEGLSPIIQPTARGMMAASNILGIKDR